MDLPDEIKSKRAIVTLSVVGFFALLTFVIFMLVNWTVFWSKTAVNVSKALKWISFVACSSALILVIIDGLAVVLTLDGVNVAESILINFVLPFSAFILKIFVYLIFVGQMYALKENHNVYRTPKIVIILLYILIIISALCVLLIIILEPMIALNIKHVDLIQQIYKWDFVVLNINELILSISVILILIKKLNTAMKYEIIQEAFTKRDSGIQFVDEDISYKHVKALSGDVEANAEYKYMKTGSKMKETNPVHIMLRLVFLSIICIFWVELLFITLLIRRIVIIKYNTQQFEVIRCIESFCAAMASLCIYLHFTANFEIYNCLCGCCHDFCLKICTKCVDAKHDNVQLNNDNDEYKEMGFMNL